MNEEQIFTAIYEIDDGYVGKSAPHRVQISDGELDDDMTAEDLEYYYDDVIEDHFAQNIFPNGSNKQEFVGWAVNVLKDRQSSAR